jgi:hypothetical protein
MPDATNDKNTQQNKPLQPGEAPPLEGFGEAYYCNDKGLIVFNEKYLLDRGYCCGNGCKHCPYDYEAVPDPKRSYLLEKRSNTNSSQ